MGPFKGQEEEGEKINVFSSFFPPYFFSPYAFFSFFPSLTKAVVSFKMSLFFKYKSSESCIYRLEKDKIMNGAMAFHKTKFALVYCVGLYLSGLLHSV